MVKDLQVLIAYNHIQVKVVATHTRREGYVVKRRASTRQYIASIVRWGHVHPVPTRGASGFISQTTPPNIF